MPRIPNFRIYVKKKLLEEEALTEQEEELKEKFFRNAQTPVK